MLIQNINTDVMYYKKMQVEIPQQSSLKFKFPAHIISLSVKTTGCKLSQDKVVIL
jgi:hypothetical protein